MINWEKLDIEFTENDIKYRETSIEDIILYSLIVPKGSIPNYPQIGCSLYDTFKCLTVDGDILNYIFKSSLETAGFDIDSTDIKVYDTMVKLQLGNEVTININPIETSVTFNTIPEEVDDAISLPVINNKFDERRFL